MLKDANTVNDPLYREDAQRLSYEQNYLKSGD